MSDVAVARETKAQLKQRVKNDNIDAASIPAESSFQDQFFDKVVLVGKCEEGNHGYDIDPDVSWDCYVVEHSGFHHHWSSAVIAVAFDEFVAERSKV